MRSSVAETARAFGEETQVAKLAGMFPGVMRVRIPVKVERMHGLAMEQEPVVIEFGTPREVLFTSETPFDFNEKIRLRTADGVFDAAASVVAMQIGRSGSAVAVRFDGEVANWIIKPD